MKLHSANASGEGLARFVHIKELEALQNKNIGRRYLCCKGLYLQHRQQD